jgi:LEA14-like dessication related protein
MKNKILNNRILKIFLVIIILISIILFGYFVINITSVKETIENVKIPEINVEADFEKLTDEGLEYSINVNVFNPNNIEIKITEFSIALKTDKNKVVGSLSIKGGIIKPESTSTFKSKSEILFEAIDAEILKLTINGEVVVKLSNFNKNLSFSIETKVIIPDIADFIFKNKTIDIEIPAQFKLRVKGILGLVGVKIFNPSEIPLFLKNVIFRIYRVDENKKTLLGEQDMDPNDISTKEQIYVYAEILIPYRKFFFSAGLKFLPNWIMLEIDGNLSIAGTRQMIPFSIKAYVDPHLIRILDKR